VISRLFVFDLDGTLIDSRRDIADSANDLLLLAGANPLPEQTIGRMVGDGVATLLARAFSASGREQPVDALDRFLEIYSRRLLEHTRPYPQVPQVLNALSERGRLAVLTNKPIDATRRILAGLDLARYFSDSFVIGGDGPLARKPDPAGLCHLIAEAHERPESTTLIGDSLIDWSTARNAGAHVCLARYGFGFEGFPLDRLDANACVVDTPEQLLRVL
jgi:phosphoglycolate phosphatase